MHAFVVALILQPCCNDVVSNVATKYVMHIFHCSYRDIALMLRLYCNNIVLNIIVKYETNINHAYYVNIVSNIADKYETNISAILKYVSYCGNIRWNASGIFDFNVKAIMLLYEFFYL